MKYKTEPTLAVSLWVSFQLHNFDFYLIKSHFDTFKQAQDFQ